MISSVYRLILLSAVVISIALGGCATVVERERLPAYHTFEVALGVASNRAIEQRTPWVFRGHGYVLSRRTHAPTLRIFETKWKTRDAFDDEAIPDTVFVETRLLIRVGRLMQVEGFRLVAPGAQSSQTVWLVAETRVRTGGERFTCPSFTATSSWIMRWASPKNCETNTVISPSIKRDSVGC